MLRKALKATLFVAGGVVAAVALLIVFKYGATAPPTAVTEPPTLAARDAARASTRPGVTLPELVYLGAAWQLLNKTVGQPPILLGNGYTNARVERTGDGRFFAGLVDRLDRRGAVTDVIIAFSGAQASGDFIQGEALAFGWVLAEPKWAAVLLERVWDDPRYARARIHVSGHSLGAGYAQFVGTEAVARHGLKAVAARLDIVVFGTPNWGPRCAHYFHQPTHVLDPLFTAYTALNDPVRNNGGTDLVGTSHFLPRFEGLTGFASIFNVIAAHWPTTYMSALGLPDWLTAAQQAASIRRVSAMFHTGNSYDPNYHLPGHKPAVPSLGKAERDDR